MWTGTFRWVKGFETSHATEWVTTGQKGRAIYVPKEAISYYTTGGRDYKYGPQKNYNRLLTVYANHNRDLH